MLSVQRKRSYWSTALISLHGDDLAHSETETSLGEHQLRACVEINTYEKQHRCAAKNSTAISSTIFFSTEVEALLLSNQAACKFHRSEALINGASFNFLSMHVYQVVLCLVRWSPLRQFILIMASVLKDMNTDKDEDFSYLCVLVIKKNGERGGVGGGGVYCIS